MPEPPTFDRCGIGADHRGREGRLRLRATVGRPAGRGPPGRHPDALDPSRDRGPCPWLRRVCRGAAPHHGRDLCRNL